MNVRDRHFRAATLSLAGWLGLAIAGCGGSKEGVDTAQVTVPEPTSASSAPAAGNAAATTTTKATEAKGNETANAPAVAPAAAGASAEGWGTLKGKVTFAGDPPAPKVLVAKGDFSVKDGKEACAINQVSSERLVVNPKSKGVRWVIVYLPKPTKVNPEAKSAALAAPLVFDQKGCTFLPHVLVGIQGATVTITSEDAVGHNANSRTLLNTKFNLPTQPGQKYTQALKTEPRPGEVGCDIHSWMKAYWFVLNNPYFAVTDADGNFEIKNVPAGEQKVSVWAEALGPGWLSGQQGEPVAIKAGGETTKDFTIDASKIRPEQ